MANHAFLFSPRLPKDDETIDKEIREFIDNKFPMLNVIYSDSMWLVTHKNDGDAIYDAVQFWIREDEFNYEDMEGVEPDSNILEFRHGHGCDLYWWLECCVRGYFAEKYNCKAYDEGIGQYDEKDEKFETFADYAKAVTALPENQDAEEKAQQEKFLYCWKMAMVKEYFERGVLPESMKQLIGEDLNRISTIQEMSERMKIE